MVLQSGGLVQSDIVLHEGRMMQTGIQEQAGTGPFHVTCFECVDLQRWFASA